MTALQQELRDLKAKNKTLTENATSHSSSSNTKIKKLKEKLNELTTENETFKVCCHSLIAAFHYFTK